MSYVVQVVGFFTINAVRREVAIYPSFAKRQAEAVTTTRAGFAVLVEQPLLGDVARRWKSSSSF